MKILTAKEASGLVGKSINEDRVGRLIQIVNKRIKAGCARGRTSAMIGLQDEDHEAINGASESEIAEVIDGLKNAGYTVSDHGPTLFRVSWQTDQEEAE